MIYRYQCKKCQDLVTVVRPVSQRNDRVRCECGAARERILEVPVINADLRKDRQGTKYWGFSSAKEQCEAMKRDEKKEEAQYNRLEKAFSGREPESLKDTFKREFGAVV